MADDKPSTTEKIGKTVGNVFSSAGPVIIVLGIGALGIYLIYNWITGTTTAAINGTEQTIKDVWTEYNTEYQQMATQPGGITENDREILAAKLDIINKATANLSGAIPNVNSWVGTIIIDGTIAAASLWALTHLGKIGDALQSLITKLRGKENTTIDPTSESEVGFVTPEEMAEIFNQTSIAIIADTGNAALASELYAAEEARYTTNIIPSMQASYQDISAQLSLLSGGQLALANYMLATYQAYFTYYPTLATPPPLFDIMPPL
jgi:hypothetical protein